MLLLFAMLLVCVCAETHAQAVDVSAQQIEQKQFLSSLKEGTHPTELEELMQNTVPEPAKAIAADGEEFFNSLHRTMRPDVAQSARTERLLLQKFEKQEERTQRLHQQFEQLQESVRQHHPVFQSFMQLTEVTAKERPETKAIQSKRLWWAPFLWTPLPWMAAAWMYPYYLYWSRYTWPYIWGNPWAMWWIFSCLMAFNPGLWWYYMAFPYFAVYRVSGAPTPMSPAMPSGAFPYLWYNPIIATHMFPLHSAGLLTVWW